MPRRNHKIKSRLARRRSAQAREAKDAMLRANTLRLTRKAARREEQKLAWSRMPAWFDRKDGA